MSDDSIGAEERLLSAALLGAVVGAVYGTVFLQDVTTGIVSGIGLGTVLAMLFPERTGALVSRVAVVFDD